jgi:hypothetical protein
VKAGASKKGEKMKQTAYTMIALLVLVGSMAVAAQAQNSGRRHLVANIPFQFNAGDATLPAGEYTITQVNPASDRAVVQIRTKGGSRTAMLQMGSVIGKTADLTSLVFHRYGNKYFLAQAWIEGESEGLSAPRSRSERATQKELAALKVAMETIALTSR